jgi:acyl-CoA synthetase (NDP forming)
VLAADAAERLGLELRPPGPGTVERLRGLVPPFAALGNPIDLTPQCPVDAYGPAVSAVFDDPAFDAVAVIDCGLDVVEFGQAVADGAARTGKPVTAFVLDVPLIAGVLDEAGIPRFASPERAVAGVRHVAV